MGGITTEGLVLRHLLQPQRLAVAVCWETDRAVHPAMTVEVVLSGDMRKRALGRLSNGV